MSGFQYLARFCDAVNARVGQAVAWVTVIMVTTQVVVVVMRYVFGFGSLHMQQSVIYMHAAVFMVAVGYALQCDAHVRIDILYSKASDKQKAWINFFGTTLILMPLCIVIWVTSWSYIVRSWSVFEGAPEGMGLQGIFLVKTLILVYATLLAVQGVSLAIGSFLTALGLTDDEAEPTG